MNKLIHAPLVAALLVAPYAALAQQAARPDGAPLTRAQVRAELAALRKVGYWGITEWNEAAYPGNIQTALTQVAPQSNGDTATGN